MSFAYFEAKNGIVRDDGDVITTSGQFVGLPRPLTLSANRRQRTEILTGQDFQGSVDPPLNWGHPDGGARELCNFRAAAARMAFRERTAWRCFDQYESEHVANVHPHHFEDIAN